MSLQLFPLLLNYIIRLDWKNIHCFPALKNKTVIIGKAKCLPLKLQNIIKMSTYNKQQMFGEIMGMLMPRLMI